MHHIDIASPPDTVPAAFRQGKLPDGDFRSISHKPVVQ